MGFSEDCRLRSDADPGQMTGFEKTGWPASLWFFTFGCLACGNASSKSSTGLSESIFVLHLQSHAKARALQPDCHVEQRWNVLELLLGGAHSRAFFRTNPCYIGWFGGDPMTTSPLLLQFPRSNTNSKKMLFLGTVESDK